MALARILILFLIASSIVVTPVAVIAQPMVLGAGPTPAFRVMLPEVASCPESWDSAYFPTASQPRIVLPLIRTGHNPSDTLPVVAAAQAQSAYMRTNTDFVKAEGSELTVGGKPYYFLGSNASYLTLPYFPEREIEPVIKYLAETQGVNVLRIWVLPEHDLERFAKILDLGAQYGIRYIVSLQNYFYYKNQSWFAHRYIEEDLPHVRAVVSRFADRPEILMWELMNEPGCGPENGSQECCDHMYAWAAAVSAEIQSLDPNHLVSLGTTLRGWGEAEQANYDRMHGLDTVDVVSIHRRVGKASRGEMQVAETLNKPVFVGEAYYQAYNDECRPFSSDVLQERADYIAKDLEWSFSHGLDGYLIWEHTPGQVTLEDGKTEWFCGAEIYLEGDPTYAVLADYLQAFARGERLANTPVDQN